MKQNNQNITTYLFYSLIIIEIIIVAILGIMKHENVSFKNEPYFTINEDWAYIDERGTTQSIDLPAQLNAGDDKTVLISRILPTNIRHLTTISILSSHQTINAYLENKLIYSRRSHQDHYFLDVPMGNLWNIIELPPGSEGKVITLEIISEYKDYAGRINEVHAGTKSALLIHNMDTSGLSLILAVITLFNGIMLSLIYIFLKKLISMNRSILFLGWFSILASIWMIMESNLTQIFIGDAYIISALTYLSLMTFPIPILLYITSIENFHYRRTIYFLNYIFLGNAILLILLQLFNVMDFHESLFIVQGEIIFLFSVVICTLCLEQFRYKNKNIKTFTISSGILFAFGLIELITYSLHAEKSIGTYFQIGFLLFTFIMIWDTLKKVAVVITLSESAKHYKYLATRDPLTNCRSRVAYETDLDRISLDREIVIFLADVDNMKQVNDTFGHHAGDEVIILCSQCLLKVFGRRVYRIGGDEFVCIEYDLNKVGIENMLSAFLAECSKANEDNPYAFQVTVGYAFYDKSLDKNIHDTVKRADKDMYERKSKMKE